MVRIHIKPPPPKNMVSNKIMKSDTILWFTNDGYTRMIFVNIDTTYFYIINIEIYNSERNVFLIKIATPPLPFIAFLRITLWPNNEIL